MDGVVRVDLANFVTIGLTAFVFVWILNRGLKYAGLTEWEA
jgi:hypothetical protein